MKRLIIATALLATIAFSFAPTATTPIGIAGFHPPGGHRTDTELPQPSVLHQQWANGPIAKGAIAKNEGSLPS